MLVPQAQSVLALVRPASTNLAIFWTCIFAFANSFTFCQNLAEILEWNLHEESVILTAEKSDVQKAKNPKWSYRPNTYVLGG